MKLTLPLELGEPRERLTQPEEPVGDIELVLGLLPGGGDVQRPGGRDARLAGLDELGDGDVDDALAAGLGAGNAEQAVDLAAGTLARGPGDLVRVVTRRNSGGLGHFCLALHVLAWFMQAGLYHHLPSFPGLPPTPQYLSGPFGVGP